MPHGGRRRGKPGKAYPNRTDMRGGGPLPVQTGPSQGYGQRVAQERAQQAMPMGPPPGAAAPAPQPPMPAGPQPGEAGDPLRATERNSEPLTSGIASGAGPGPEALGFAKGGNDFTIDEIRALYSAFPNEDLRQLIEDDDEGVLF